MSDFWVGPAAKPDTYRLVSLLGGGGEGEVWKAVLPLSTGGRHTVAVKISRVKDDDDPGGVAWEQFGHLLRSMSHPGLVRVTDVFLGPEMHREADTPPGLFRYVVMDYIDGVNLREWAAENLDATASQRLRLLGMVAAALDEMHSGARTEVAVAHGDVKPANIVVRSDGAAILVDLGLARLADSNGVAGRSAAYAAPELRTRAALATPEADRFAFAVTTAQVLTGQPPPVGADGWLDPEALRQLLASNPVTARRHMLVSRIMNVITSPPEARPLELRPWLDGAVESLSQATSGGIIAMTPATTPPRPAELTPTPAAASQESAPTFPAARVQGSRVSSAVGEQFGPYRLDSLLGRGGMGEVYRALDTSRDRVVALKRLPASLANDPEFQARFREESNLAARLNEPHIIPIHDFGEIDGRLFIDMRLVEGTDLAHLLAASGPLAPARAIHIVRQVASALDAAHAADLIHRDVKPANILLRSSQTDTSTGTDVDDGQDFAYLVDFGIARAISSTKPGLTGTGSAIGSIIYMAPERFHGRSDHRVDVYSLGCLLYEALTGQRPFPAEDQAAVMHAHLTQPPPRPSRTNPAVPPALDTVVATAMAKHPKDRYHSAGALAAAARTALAVAEGVTVPDAGNASTSHIPAPPPWYTGTPTGPSDPVRATLGQVVATPQRREPRVVMLGGTLAVLIVLACITGYRLLGPSTSATSAAGWAGDDSSLVVQEPIRTSSVDPFMPSIGTDAPNVEQPPESHGTYSGGTPGLYGGTLNNAECDRPAMISFLQTNPDKAAAWAQVENITPTDIPAYINGLTPVLLRGDTGVTNHGFKNGQATTLQSVLQTGSAVLVDAFGVPRARCYCGNPLSPPTPAANAHYNPPAWPQFNPTSVLRTEPNTTPVPELTLVDVSTKNPFLRPVGSSGDRDHSTTAPPPTDVPVSPGNTATPAPAPPPIQPGPTSSSPSPAPRPCVPPSKMTNDGCRVPPCPSGQHYNSQNVCTANFSCIGGTEKVGDKCQPIQCPAGEEIQGDVCGPKPCPDGKVRVGSECRAVTSKEPNSPPKTPVAKVEDHANGE